jgi:putative redox protein
MVEQRAHYQGELHCTVVHGPSGRTLETDAPTDNMGKGESFSPTDLVATALGTCAVTTMGILATRKSWNIAGIDFRIEKHMTTDLPRKVARLVLELRVPPEVSAALDDDARRLLEHTARHCPVALSLHPDIDLQMRFAW